ncbi:MAG: FAD-dependent oxidoreductase, partial [Actinomycetota bacterium]|nr:FAD-dependent oxidoreductase [Actinomycetota bacterium]
MPGILSSSNRTALVGGLDGSVFDVVVIGGGVTGCGVALDAAQRGLSVLLVEATDLAAGTSSKSTKLIHGGLRYLEQRDFPLVREALTERGRMVATLCPHLVRPLPFLFPLAKGVIERGYVGAGVALYDGLAVTGGDKLPRHTHLGRRAAIERFPSLRADMLTGAVQYWDAQVDDARHTLMVARSAAALGAEILTGARVTGLHRSGAGAVTGARIDVTTDGVTVAADVSSRVIMNATGAWSGLTEHMAGDTSLAVAASKGVHLVVPAHRIAGSVALITKTSTSVLFVIPFGHNWLIGTTDTPYSGDVDDPQADSGDVDYLLAQANRWLTAGL